MDLQETEIESNNDESSSERSDSDNDDCDELTLKNLFSKTYNLSAEKALTLEENYIIRMSCTRESSPKICAALSDNTCELYNITESQLNKVTTLFSHRNSTINVKFSSEDNLLYTGSTDNIKLWDLRILKPVLDFKDTSGSKKGKPLTEFDVSPNNRLLCGGTELFEGDAFLLFWDIRNASLLGGYWETHTDDITKILFHSTNNNKLATGSTDGLINVYDLTQTSESNALLNTLNTESSVENFLWCTENNFDRICSITHTTNVQLWDIEEALPTVSFNRKNIASGIKRTSPKHMYVVNAHTRTSTDDIFILAGSNFRNGENVRALNIEDKKLTARFRLTENKQRIRTSCYNPDTDLLITGGERCILNVWQPGNSYKIDKMGLKNTSPKKKLYKKDPY